jgi:Tol biopolymer transport system component
MASGPSASGAAPATPAAEPSATASTTVRPGEAWIVYQLYDVKAKTFSLHLVRPDGTGDHVLMGNKDGDPMHPDWSPDGEQVTYVANNQVWVVNVDGSSPQTLYRCSDPCVGPDNPAWSPDGAEIAFQTGDIVGGEVRAGVILAVNLQSGSRRALFTTQGPEYARYTRWSPDGKSIVVELDRYKTRKTDDCTPTGSAIAVVPLGKRAAAKVLTDWPMIATYPDWNPTDNRIVFSTIDLGDRDGGCVLDVSPPSDLYTIGADGSGLAQITHNPTGSTPVRYATARGPLSSQPTWAPDGRSIIFVQTTGSEWPGWTMATLQADGSGFASATGAAFMLGTHPRLRPTR